MSARWFSRFLMYFHWRTDDFGMSAWPWPDCCFVQADCMFYLRWFSAVFRSVSYFFSGIVRWHRILPCLAPQIGRFVEFSVWHWHCTTLLYLTSKIACFIYHDFLQFSGLSHTPFQELSGDVGSCLAPQIGRFDVENLDSKNPEIYHDFRQFSGKNPGSYHVFRTFPGANPEFCNVFLPFSGKNSQLCHVLLTFSGENLRIFHDFQKSLGCLRLQVRRIKFSFYDGVARKDVRSFLGLSPVRRRQGCSCNLETRDLLVAGPVGRRQGYNCNLGTRDFLAAGPDGRRQGYNCNLGTRDFWW